MSDIKNAHDAAFQAILCDNRMAQAFFTQHLPADLKSILKLDTLKLAKSLLVDENLTRTINDIVYEVETTAGAGYLMLHLEHQSTAEKYMPLRFLKYAVSGLYHHLKQGHTTLPIIIPILYYHGRVSPYPHSLDLFDYFADKELARQYMFKPVQLIDLTVIPDEELKKHTETALFHMVQKHIFARDLLPMLEDLAKGHILEASAGWIDHQHFRIVINYIIARAEISDRERFKALLTEHSGEMGRDVMTLLQQYEQEKMTLLQQYEQEKHQQFQSGIKQGMQHGREEGIQQGVEQGIKQGIQQVARRLLQLGRPLAEVEAVTGLSLTVLQQLQQEVLH